jgi:hypothetical protein
MPLFRLAWQAVRTHVALTAHLSPKLTPAPLLTTLLAVATAAPGIAAPRAMSTPDQ